MLFCDYSSLALQAACVILLIRDPESLGYLISSKPTTVSVRCEMFGRV